MEKKILIISQHYPPEIGAASNRVAHIVSRLIQNGYKVYVVTSQPSYPSTSLYVKEKRIYKEKNLTIYRSPAISYGSGILQRLLNQLLFLIIGFWGSLYVSIRYSVRKCLTTSPPFIVNFMGFFLRVLLRIEWIMEIRDLWPDSLLAVGAIRKNSKLFLLLKKFEYLFYTHSSKIVVVTKKTKEILVLNKVCENKVHIITNGIPDWILEGKKVQNVKFDRTFSVSYIGNIGLSQNLEIMIDVAEQFSDEPNIKFYFIGEGLNKIHLVEMAKSKSLNNVSFIDGEQDKSKLLEWYNNTDLGVVSLKSAQLFETVIPSKIFEYAALNIPILFIGQIKGEASELINDFSLGYNVGPDVKLIKEIIFQIRAVSVLCRDKRRKNRFIDRYCWDTLGKEYIRVLEI